MIDKKKLLFVSNSSSDKVNYIIDSFKERDDLYIEILHQYKKTIQRTFITKVFEKLKIPLDVDDLNKRLLSSVKEFNPEIIFIVKGNCIYPSTLKFLKVRYKNIHLISFSNDNMSLWNNKSIYYHLGINYYDLVVSINIEAYRKIEKFCKTKIVYIDKSYSKKHHKYIEKTDKQYECVFIGSYEKERFEIMKYLALNGVEVNIFGNMWNKADTKNIPEKLIIHYKELVGLDYNNMIVNSKVVLGFLRQKNFDTQTSRTFEIPASGGFMIMEYTQNQDRIFKENQDMVYFKTQEELLEKVKYYIDNQDKAKQIIDNAREACLKNGYEYNNRIDFILEEILTL